MQNTSNIKCKNIKRQLEHFFRNILKINGNYNFEKKNVYAYIIVLLC